MELIYVGKAKEIYHYDSEHVLIKYTNNATAFNGVKHDLLDSKGMINNEITLLIFNYLESCGIKTHLVKKYDDLSQICMRLDIIPLEIIIRNVVAGSMAKRLGMEEGTVLNQPIFELSYKKDELGDPLINHDHAVALNVATYEQLDYIYDKAMIINVVLKELFQEIDLNLIDFKLEFGINLAGDIILADEFSPDNCRLWEIGTNEKFDKDRFRRDLGDVMKYYSIVLERLRGALDE